MIGCGLSHFVAGVLMISMWQGAMAAYTVSTDSHDCDFLNDLEAEVHMIWLQA